MNVDSEQILDSMFLSYNKILNKLNNLGLITKHGKDISEMDIKQLCEYFNRKDITVRKAINKMCKSGFIEYKSLVNNKVVVSSSGVEWLCENVFKQKYLELLEKYKMELTELYIEEGYPYDNFFFKN